MTEESSSVSLSQSPRRSSRSRRQSSSYYEDAKTKQEEEAERRKQQQKQKQKRDQEEEKAEEEAEEEEDENENEEVASDADADADADAAETSADEAEEEEEEEMEESDESEEDDEDDEDYGVKKPSPKKTKATTTPVKRNQNTKANSRAKSSKAKAKPSKAKKIQIQIRPKGISPNKRSSKRKSAASGSATATIKAIRSALATLANRALEEKETPANSLVAAILDNNTNNGNNSHSHSDIDVTTVEDVLEDASLPPTMHTAHLTKIARSIVALHNQDPNAAQIRLINLLFRSVGGTTDCNLPHDDEACDEIRLMQSQSQTTQLLEEMDEEEWGAAVTDVVDEMRHTAPECILFCSDPDGAVHLNLVENCGAGNVPSDDNDEDEDVDVKHVSLRDVPIAPSSLGVREYRNMFQEFWYILGHVAMMEGAMSGFTPTTMDDDDDSDDDDEDDSMDVDVGRKRKAKSKSTKKSKKKQKQNLTSGSSRFDTEIVRDILSRLNGLNSVGQPDIRAASTVAVLALSHAILDKTIHLNTKLGIVTRQFAAAIGSSQQSQVSVATAKTGKSGRSTITNAKAESLRHQVDLLKRTRTDLEEMVESLVIKAVFIHRYRDSNMFIRSTCIQALGEMAIRRSDLFLSDKYLKYFGWMMSDKAEIVRVMALQAINRPFEIVKAAELNGNGNGKESKIDLSVLENVLSKFLSRITDCVIDVHASVQECAMTLMLSMLRVGLLDDVDDDEMWDKVNILAFEEKTTAQVRRDALYFIMEQLEEFDEGNVEEGNMEKDGKAAKRGGKSKSKKKSTNERLVAQRLDAIASWAAHNLTDGNVQLEKIKIHLVDHLVHSLRAMPEHKSIVTNWPAMIRAISDEKLAMTTGGTTAGDRADIAKQRVLVQMLACAAKCEVESVTDTDFLQHDMDPDDAAILNQEAEMHGNETAGMGSGSGTRKGVKKNMATGLNHESLSVALLKALPSHLDKFRSDSLILESLACLPRYFIPSVFSLPERKTDFLALLKSLKEIYLLSTDENVLGHCARSIIYLSEGDHARSNEAKTAVQKVFTELRDRITTHLTLTQTEKGKDDSDTEKSNKKSRRKSPRHSQDFGGLSDDDNDDDLNLDSRKEDNEYALYLNLLRARVLSKLCDLSQYADTDENGATENLCNSIADGLTHRLDAAKASNELDDGDTHMSPPITTTGWKGKDLNLSLVTAGSIEEGLQLILSIISWKVLEIQEEKNLFVDNNTAMDEDGNEDDNDEVEDHVVLRLRSRTSSLLEKCFDQFLPNDGLQTSYSTIQKEWSHNVQEVACEIAVDLRTLFPKEWSNAVSPLLRALAITDDGRLIGGFVRYFRVKNMKPELSTKVNKKVEKANDLLLPFGRSVAFNWKLGNRREAGVLLSHITGSGAESTEVVTAVSRLLKKVQPVRLLEAQMASLRQSYEDWILNDPSDKRSDINDQDPSDEMMEKYELEERQHKEQFKTIIQQAACFSQSLGVRKLSDEETISPALLGFVREGLRFSFSNSDDLMLGSRLSFLSILVKYSNWIKKNSEHKKSIAEDLRDKEHELKMDDDFEEVHEDDFEALFEFREAIGLEPSAILSTDASTIGGDTNSIRTGTVATPRTHASGNMTPHTNASSGSAVTPNSTLTPYTHDYSKAVNNEDEESDTANDETRTMRTTPSRRTVRSSSSSVGSVKSMMSSVRSSLSPLHEDQDEEGSGEGIGSLATPAGKSTVGSEEYSGDEGSRQGSRSLATPAGKSTVGSEEYSGDEGSRQGSRSLATPAGKSTVGSEE